VTLPTISVIIPTYNRPAQIAACLQSLTHLDYPAERWEVIVVDDGGPEPLDAVAAPFGDRLSLALLRQPNAGPAIARNAGAERAGGAFLAFTDDDCAPDPGWLRALAAAWAETPDQGVGGRTVNALPGNACAAASQLLVDYVYGYYNRPGPGGARFFASNNLAFPAEGFRAVGGFDARFGRAASEDRGLCDRWLAAGRRLRYAPDAVIRHSHAMRLRDYWRQHHHYGVGAYHFHRLRAAGPSNGGLPRLEPPAFYVGMLTHAFRHAPCGARPRGILPPLLSALMGLSQVASAVGYFGERARQARRNGACG